jgi:hypothetical protein
MPGFLEMPHEDAQFVPDACFEKLIFAFDRFRGLDGVSTPQAGPGSRIEES